MNKEFSPGDKVWVYTPPSPPQAGVVEHVRRHGVWIVDDLGRRQIYYAERLYHRPAERLRLLTEMSADASAILRAARRIAEEESEDLE